MRSARNDRTCMGDLLAVRSWDEGLAAPRAPVCDQEDYARRCRPRKVEDEVLDADRIGDEEECALRDHLLAVHPNTLKPETVSVLLEHFVVTEPPPAAYRRPRDGAFETASRRPQHDDS